MATVHIALKDGTQQEYSEEELRALWAAAKLPSTALYWKPGMAGWEPLVGYFAARQGMEVAPVSAVHTGARRYRLRQDPRLLTAVYVVLSVASIGVAIFQILGILGMSDLLPTADQLIEPDPSMAARNMTTMLILAGLTLVELLVYFMWVYRANANSQGLGARGMRFTPGWAVGWSFVPVMNLFRPYQVMREIWQASGDPEYWRDEPGGVLLNLWWGLYLAMLALAYGNAYFRWEAEVAGQEFQFVQVELGVHGLHLAFRVVAVLLIVAIVRRQRALVTSTSAGAA